MNGPGLRLTFLRPVNLNRRDVYVTPLGRRCMLKPAPADGGRDWHGQFAFVYLDLPGGFSLTVENVRILRTGG